MMLHIEKELTRGFSKLVRGVNTRNPSWKKHIGAIDLQIRPFLEREVVNGNIFQFELEILRVGQSLIECKLKYLDRYFDKSQELTLRERVRSPRQTCDVILHMVTEEIIFRHKNNI